MAATTRQILAQRGSPDAGQAAATDGTANTALVEELYRRYWFQVQRRCRRILANPDDATDAAQEVFVRLIRRGGDFRGDAEWTTWLYRVATNVCLNRLRSVQRREAAMYRRAQQPEPAQSEAEDSRVARDALVSIIDHFDDRTVEVALHYFVDEMSQGEIAELMRVSRVAINRRLSRFRKRARALLEQRGEP